MSDSEQETTVKDRPVRFNRKFVQTLAWVITIVWALSMVANALLTDYTPPGSIHVLMMIVVGAAFGTNFIKM